MLKKILNVKGAQKLTKTEQEAVEGGRNGNGPCGNTGFDVIEHITDPDRCFGYGFYWFNGRCIVCR